MKFVLLVEGYTEQKALPDFLRRSLDAKGAKEHIGFQAVRFEGWADMVKRVVRKANFYLDAANHPDVIAVVSLLDLHGPNYPAGCASVTARRQHFKGQFEAAINTPRFQHFSAVHELEAWLLSHPQIFPVEIRSAIAKINAPEAVNFDQPPAVFLDRLYEKGLKESYKKTVHGVNLFRELDPVIAEAKCPRLKELVSWLVARATVAGLM